MGVYKNVYVMQEWEVPNRGECGNNPGYKYDVIYDVVIFNLNPITKMVDLNQCGDKFTWGHRSYGEGWQRTHCSDFY